MSSIYSIKAALLFGIMILTSGALHAQENDSLVYKKIQSHQYVFVPQSFSSSTINSVVQVKDFDLRVMTDSIIALLPYYGQSYTPQIGRSDDDGIRFTSTQFEYAAVLKKKGKWEITIKPKDVKGLQVFMTVYSNGEASMDVTSPRRETMSYKGYIR